MKHTETSENSIRVKNLINVARMWIDKSTQRVSTIYQQSATIPEEYKEVGRNYEMHAWHIRDSSEVNTRYT